MDIVKLRENLESEFEQFVNALATDDGEWIVKGFIDVYQHIYTLSIDTKVVSKIIELMLFPILARFAREWKLELILGEHQNHYPDVTLLDADGNRFALDLKSTYRTNKKGTRVNGFTLGAFTGYFRQRKSSKNVSFPYGSYAGHLVLGVIYSRAPGVSDERRKYKLVELQDIVSVVRDFDFLVQEKWRLATDLPGSGNTKNIGSIKDIGKLKGGQGTFAEHGEAVFDELPHEGHGESDCV